MTRSVLALSFGIVFGAAFAATTSQAADAPRPNIVLCMADDQGWGDVGYYGHPVLKTPVLDEMARTGLRFDRFYAAAPVCSPTRGSVLTGRHPNRFGCFQWGYTLRPQEVTVAEALKSAGYTTGHFGKWHLGPCQADSLASPGHSGFDTWFSSPNFYENSPLMSANGKVVQTQGESSAVTMQAAIDFIRSATKAKQPFLAVVWFGNPHGPHVAVDELKALYPDQLAPLQNYYGEITGIDQSMGMLRQALRELDVADETLVWYTSDNGAQGPGSTGGLSGKKGSLWEGGVRVPGIIEWPARIRTPRVTELATNTVDIYPTLLELTGAKVEHQPVLDGQSLVRLIDGKLEERDKGFGFWIFPQGGKGVRSGELLAKLMQEQKNGVAVSTESTESPQDYLPATTYDAEKLGGHSAWMEGAYKLHRIPGDKGVKYSLFDLDADREEKHDLIDAEPERAAKMKSSLDAWLKSVVNSLNGNDYNGGK